MLACMLMCVSALNMPEVCGQDGSLIMHCSRAPLHEPDPSRCMPCWTPMLLWTRLCVSNYCASLYSEFPCSVEWVSVTTENATLRGLLKANTLHSVALNTAQTGDSRRSRAGCSESCLVHRSILVVCIQRLDTLIIRQGNRIVSAGAATDHKTSILLSLCSIESFWTLKLGKWMTKHLYNNIGRQDTMNIGNIWMGLVERWNLEQNCLEIISTTWRN